MIGDAAGDCAGRYCFENAKYWAMWNQAMTITPSIAVKRASKWGDLRSRAAKRRRREYPSRA
jgi:hypothetical protein